jgi:peptidoglycan/LPS O-acetylase OafA/YrhL
MFFAALMNAFLSWYPWVPLSRLAYGVYLAHTVIITRNVAAMRNPVHYDYLSVVSKYL